MKPETFILTVIILLGILFYGCQEDPAISPQNLGTISGKIERSPGQGLPNVKVSTEPATRTVETNSFGLFLIPDVPQGTYIIRTSLLGYYDDSTSVNVSPNSTVTANFTLKSKPSSIFGKVTSTDGSPLPGVEIKTIPSTAISFTNEIGEYLIENISAGTYIILAQLSGFKNKTDTIIISSGQSLQHNMTLLKLTTIDKMIGNWISEGNDIAPKLVDSLQLKKIITSFQSNNQYTIKTYNNLNTETIYSGTYNLVDMGVNNINIITMNQNQPTLITYEGICKITTSDHLIYEIIQTVPSIPGVTPPNVTEGFGSTRINNAPAGNIWIQGFTRANIIIDPIIGTWLSDGDNVAIGLKATLKTKSINATFRQNSTYTIIATDSANVAVTYNGTYATTAAAGTTLRNIVLNQTTPTSVTSTGIYQVTAKGVLTYEVIQTTPSIPGFTPPNINEGFGSTKYNSFPLGATWVQKFLLIDF